MNNLPFLAQRLFNTPLAITPGKMEIIIAALADRFGISKIFRADGSSFDMDSWDKGEETVQRGYDMVGPVAVIPVQGTLVQKLGRLRPYSGMTGYDSIRANLSVALNDDDAKAVIFDIESGGGEVAGLFDLMDAIYSSRGDKEIWAVLTETAYSAAYGIASCCDKVIVPRTGGTGSVGVICAHVDFSKALAKDGIAVTLLTYGDRKADGSEYLPLGKEAYDRFMSDIVEMGDMFTDLVARNRGMSVKRVRDTQAATFMGANGVSVGFADAVMSPEEAFNSLLSELGQ